MRRIILAVALLLSASTAHAVSILDYLSNKTIETKGFNVPASAGASQIVEILQPATNGTHKASITADPNLTTNPEVKITDSGVLFNGEPLAGASSGAASDYVPVVPAYRDSACTKGQWAVGGGYHYDCVAANTWEAVAYGTNPLSSSPTDTTPNDFVYPNVFTAQPNVALSTVVTSNPITVLGVTAPTPISIVGGTFDVNGSENFTSTSGWVSNTETIRARHTSSASNSTATNTVVTIGGKTATFTSTTLAAAAPTKYASYEGTVSSGTQVNYSASVSSVGGIIDSATSHDPRELWVYVRTAVGSPSAKSYKARIYSLNGSKGLATIKAESTNTITGITAAGYIKFTFASGTLAQGDAWAVYGLDAADNTSYITIGYANYTDPTPDLDGGYSHHAFWNSSGALVTETLTRDNGYALYQ